MTMVSLMVKKEIKAEINFWATSLHGQELGIKQKEVWMAKSRQFTRDMDIVGSISENGKDSGFVAYRKKLWESNKRLVVKTFSKTGSWQGSLEELVAEELKSSLYADEPTPAFAIILPRYNYITTVRRIYRPGLRQKETYAFQVIDNDQNVEIYTIVGARFSIGNDFKIIRENDVKEIGRIDSKVLDIGGKVEVALNDELAVKNVNLFNILVTFTSSLKFLDWVKDALKERLKALEKQKLKYKIKLARDETLLYTNPRRIKI